VYLRSMHIQILQCNLSVQGDSLDDA
jgi:hypothetical protein